MGDSDICTWTTVWAFERRKGRRKFRPHLQGRQETCKLTSKWQHEWIQLMGKFFYGFHSVYRFFCFTNFIFFEIHGFSLFCSPSNKPTKRPTKRPTLLIQSHLRIERDINFVGITNSLLFWHKFQIFTFNLKCALLFGKHVVLCCVGSGWIRDMHSSKHTECLSSLS